MDSHAHELALQQGLGLEIAEFCTAWNLDDQFPETDKAVQHKLSCSNRYVLHGPFNELFPCAIDLKIRSIAAHRYRQVIQTASKYGISKIVLHAGYNPWLYYPCWFVEQSILFWKDFVSEIPDGTEICLENVLEEEPTMLLDILRAVDNPKLRMCLDIGHSHTYSKVTPLEWLDRCVEFITHFHLHNNDGSRDSHNSLSCGTIPMAPLLDAMDAVCPTASITLEVEDCAPSLQWLAEQNILKD